MVTLLEPKTPTSNAEHPEAAVQEEAARAGSTHLSYALGTLAVASAKTQHNASFISGIARPLLVLYDLVAGPPMTQRDRRRREVGEAAIRDSASFVWFNRTPGV